MVDGVRIKTYSFKPNTMKTTLLITLSFFWSNLSFSQVWIDQDAIWHYNIDAGGLFQGFSRYDYTRDSLIQGHNCQLIDKSQHRVQNFGGIYSHSDHQMETNFTYTNGDTVFWLVENEFKVLYNFGAQIGDTWSIANADVATDCLEAIVEVDSIGTILMNGQNLRWIKFHTQDNSSYLYSGKAVEKFGLFEMNYYSPHALFPVKTDCTEGTVIDFFFNQFTCYEDASFNLYNVTSQDCEYKSQLSTNNLMPQENGINFYVDQTNKSLRLDTKEISANIDCYVVNNMGQIVIKSVKLFKYSNSESINASQLKSGIYFLIINSDNFKQTERFLID